ncbi:glycoside hydrolase family 65 [candidate division KSB1 bacterium]|nr:glycoside hydrolase family 65 [candidate division KSB1 bacterium]
MFFFACGNNRIDRKALVKRHIPTVDHVDVLSPFSVGNGEFAFTVDVTGLQTFMEEYNSGILLGTHAQWGWHTVPNPNQYTLDQTFEYLKVDGRQVPYASKQNSEAGQWLRANPHRLHLGKIGFSIQKSDGNEIQISDIKEIKQSADIWEGIIHSAFSVEDHPIHVETSCHPDVDQIAVRVQSDLLKEGQIDIIFEFPYGSLAWGPQSADWNSPNKHTSEIIVKDDNSVLIQRTLDTDIYYAHIQWEGNAQFDQLDVHSFKLSSSESDELKMTCRFSKERDTNSDQNVENTFHASKSHWQNFWQTGGAVDFSGSIDHRAHELERRVILSRYLTAIQCAGSIPPSETGLTCNSWYGKFHLEMHWWHAVQFALWGKPDLLEKSLAWYNTILPMAKQKGERQGYEGVRWPKMVGFDGRESPSTIGVFLIWQQPHPIYYAELLYQIHSHKETLEKYQNLVFESADFMASFARWDGVNDRYIIGPPLIPAQEIYPPAETLNPAFELAYWAWGLKTAQKWRERLGLPRQAKWDHVIDHLADIPITDSLYQNAENAMSTFEDPAHRKDHPTLLGVLGMLPYKTVDVKVLQNTLDRVMTTWDWEHTWGWDYPLIAMTAARVGKPETAVDALLMDVPKNTYLNNGHNYQTQSLPLYLPGNGGLLTAVAMMAGGWIGAPDTNAPGFPKDGSWKVKFEGLNPLL